MKASNSMVHHSEIVNRKNTSFNKIDPSPAKNKLRDGDLPGVDTNMWGQFYTGKVDQSVRQYWNEERTKNKKASVSPPKGPDGTTQVIENSQNTNDQKRLFNNYRVRVASKSHDKRKANANIVY